MGDLFTNNKIIYLLRPVHAREEGNSGILFPSWISLTMSLLLA